MYAYDSMKTPGAPEYEKLKELEMNLQLSTPQLQACYGASFKDYQKDSPDSDDTSVYEENFYLEFQKYKENEKLRTKTGYTFEIPDNGCLVTERKRSSSSTKSLARKKQAAGHSIIEINILEEPSESDSTVVDEKEICEPAIKKSIAGTLGQVVSDLLP